jgi:plastocyanin
MRVVLLALLTVTVALAGCAGDDSDGAEIETGTPTGSPTPTETGGSGSGEKRGPVTWEVVMDEVAFQDNPSVVQAGDTVRWVHEDGTTLHRVETREGAPESFDSGDMTEANNAEFSFTFDEVGDYPYFCRYHEGVMSESIEVREAYSGTPGDVPEEPEDPGGPGGGDGSENGTQNGTGPLRPPVTWSVSIAGTAFVDGTLTVQEGDTVEWVHEDGVTPHTVTADDGSFGSGPVYLVQAPMLDTFSHTFEEVGDFSYFCEVHPSMQGMITVVERFDATPT